VFVSFDRKLSILKFCPFFSDHLTCIMVYESCLIRKIEKIRVILISTRNLKKRKKRKKSKKSKKRRKRG